MKKFSIGLGIFISILLIIAICIGGMWSHRNTMVELDEKINAQYTSNKSTYDNMWKKFKEMSQVSDMQSDKIKELYQELVSGRSSNTNLLFNAIKEENPQLDQSTFINLQNEIASSRNAFNNSQKQITDIVREYNTYVKKKFITSAIFNYETKNSEDFITTSDKTTKAFEDKKDDEIQIGK